MTKRKKKEGKKRRRSSTINELFYEVNITHFETMQLVHFMNYV
jgi:hypothetical protein